MLLQQSQTQEINVEYKGTLKKEKLLYKVLSVSGEKDICLKRLVLNDLLKNEQNIIAS